MPIAFKNLLPAETRYRSIHEDTIEELGDILKRGWNTSFSMTVVSTPCGKVRVVDGSHRYSALLRLSRKVPAEIDPDYPVQCTVLEQHTPARILTALAGKTNIENEACAKMTLPDRVFYLVIVVKEALHVKSLDFNAECLWIISSAEIQTALQDGTGSTVEIAKSKSMLDGLVALVRQWVTAHDVQHWGVHYPQHALYASLWQNIAFVNERGSAFWVELYMRWTPYIKGLEGFLKGLYPPAPQQDTYAAELKKNGIVTYHAMYPGICNDADYVRKALESLGPKHMRPKYEFLWQRLVAQFLLTGKTATKAFTESVTKQWTTQEGQEGDLYALWLAASNMRKRYNSSMAGTIWHSMSACDWPLCAGHCSTPVQTCDVCDAYSACEACSVIDALGEMWPRTKLFVLLPDTTRRQMSICPVCAVCFVMKAATTEDSDLLADDGRVRDQWSILATKADKSAAKECITCGVGLACLAHGSKQFWSRAAGEYRLEDLATNVREWLNGQHRVLTDIFTNLASRTFLAEEKRKFTTAREVETKVALGSTDLGMWTAIEPGRKAKAVKATTANVHIFGGNAPQSSPVATKLEVYNKLLAEATPSGPQRSLRIEHSTWQKWWEEAKSDETQKGRYSFVYLDPMYDDFPSSSDFEKLRALIYYVTTPGAVILLFHGFIHLVAYANKLCEPSTKKTVTYIYCISPLFHFFFAHRIRNCTWCLRHSFLGERSFGMGRPKAVKHQGTLRSTRS